MPNRTVYVSKHFRGTIGSSCILCSTECPRGCVESPAKNDSNGSNTSKQNISSLFVVFMSDPGFALSEGGPGSQAWQNGARNIENPPPPGPQYYSLASAGASLSILERKRPRRGPLGERGGGASKIGKSKLRETLQILFGALL